LEKLLRKWGIGTPEWILVSQYAYKLLGYDVMLRKGHLNILVKKHLIPWKIKEGLEIHPPRGSKFRDEFEKFIEKTGFDFDINLATDNEYKAKEGFYVLYKLPNNKIIRVQKLSGGIKAYEKFLELSNEEGLGTERLEKEINSIKNTINALLKAKDKGTVADFQNLLEKYRLAKKKQVRKKPPIKSLITGIVASPGKVVGKVKIIKDRKDSKYLADHSVLVTKMTSPVSMVPLKKISAIITDLGGKLSHAAILAREMGIPCIVGTQNATKVLKNGDLVEVDANIGVVRIVQQV
jgi:phosphohistidine swiveling domain-containing protein